MTAPIRILEVERGGGHGQGRGELVNHGGSSLDTAAAGAGQQFLIKRRAKIMTFLFPTGFGNN